MANPTGKGGFGERPQDINREGLNRRDPQDWKSTVKRITNMTRDEAIEYVGKRSKVARLLRELPADLPIKDALVFISIIQYGRDPNPRMLSVLMDREEGKPPTSIDVTTNGKDINKVIIEYVDDPTSQIAPSADSNQSEPQEV